MIVPKALRVLLGRSVFKHSLRTYHLLQARAHAYVLGLRYAVAFAAARTAIMAKPPIVEDILAAGNRGG